MALLPPQTNVIYKLSFSSTKQLIRPKPTSTLIYKGPLLYTDKRTHLQTTNSNTKKDWWSCSQMQKSFVLMSKATLYKAGGTLSTRRHRFVLIQIIVAELETVLIGSTEIYLLCSEVTHLGINPTQSHILAVVQKIYWKNSTWFFISISVCNDLHLGSSKVSDLSSIEDWCGMMGVRLQSDWSKSVSSFLSSRKIAATTSCQMIKAAELWLY